MMGPCNVLTASRPMSTPRNPELCVSVNPELGVSVRRYFTSLITMSCFHPVLFSYRGPVARLTPSNLCCSFTSVPSFVLPPQT